MSSNTDSNTPEGHIDPNEQRREAIVHSNPQLNGLPRLSNRRALDRTQLHPLPKMGVKADEEVGTSGGNLTEGHDVNATEEEGVEEINDSDSDFELVEKPVYTPTASPSLHPTTSTSAEIEEEPPVYADHTESDANETATLLTSKLPAELISPVLDYAEYFPSSIIGTKDTEDSVGVRSLRDDDPTKQGKVYLTVTIPDFPAFEAGTAGTAGKGGAEGAGGRRGRVRRLVFKLRSRDQGWSSHASDHNTFRGCWSWIEVELYRDGTLIPPPQLLQRNLHAHKSFADYEIVWDWKEDELEDEEAEKWEEEADATNRWERGGKIRNGRFVRELRGGDELKIVLRAQYPGWACQVRKCEVECYWAV